MTEPRQSAEDVRDRHWSIDVAHVSQWEELEIRPDELRQGDLWLDPHGDSLRGVVRCVRRLENMYAWEISFYGIDPWWRWHARDQIRVIRTARTDGPECS